MAKKKLKDLKQTNGKLDREPRTLDQVFGISGIAKYGTFNEDEYRKKICEMSITELWTHAAEMGIQPIDNRQRLHNTLLTEFKKYVYSCNAATYKPKTKKLTKKQREEQQRILAIGKP